MLLIHFPSEFHIDLDADVEDNVFNTYMNMNIII